MFLFGWILPKSTTSTITAPVIKKIVRYDKVRMYEEIMTNDDNLESSLLTSSLLKMLVQVEQLYCSVAGGELKILCSGDLTLQVNYSAGRE